MESAEVPIGTVKNDSFRTLFLVGAFRIQQPEYYSHSLLVGAFLVKRSRLLQWLVFLVGALSF